MIGRSSTAGRFTLAALIPLAPLHQPHNLSAIEAVARWAPELPQVACFDTAFHCTQPRVARQFARPRRFTEGGVLRYGFHGLSYHQSDLLGVLGISSDMRTLPASADPRAAEAVDLFIYRIGREIGSLAAALGGLDALVFTGGIGENAAPIRARVVQDAAWLGLELDESANAAGGPLIARSDSRVSARVVPTNEELMIAMHAKRALSVPNLREPGIRR